MGEHVCFSLPRSLHTSAVSNKGNSVTNASLWRQAQAKLPPDEQVTLFTFVFYIAVGHC